MFPVIPKTLTSRKSNTSSCFTECIMLCFTTHFINFPQSFYNSELLPALFSSCGPSVLPIVFLVSYHDPFTWFSPPMVSLDCPKAYKEPWGPCWKMLNYIVPIGVWGMQASRSISHSPTSGWTHFTDADQDLDFCDLFKIKGIDFRCALFSCL